MTAQPSPFTAAQLDALCALRAHWESVQFVLIGASALGCHYDLRWRQTRDLDVTVSLDLDASGRGFDLGLPGWARDSLQEHRWLAPGDVRVDVLPAGPDLLLAGVLEWPQSGQRMSLLGFRHVFARAMNVPLAPDLELLVASPPVLVLLKLVAYLDRPFARQRDLQDLAYLLEEYVPEEDERRWTEEILTSGLAFEDVAAFLLGRDLAALLDSLERDAVQRFLRMAEDEAEVHATQAHLLRLGPASWGKEPARLLHLLSVLRRGTGI